MSDVSDNRQMIEAGQFFDIWRLLSAPRPDNEAMIRSLCRTVYLGSDTALCRILGRYKMYVDTRDVSISSHLLLEGFWEMWVTEAMLRHVRPGMTVLDIGANLGYFTLLLADLVGPAGKVLAFEPNPEMASRARRSISINGFSPTTTLHEIALADSDGEMLLDVVDSSPGGAHLVAMPAAVAPPTVLPSPSSAGTPFAPSIAAPLIAVLRFVLEDAVAAANAEINDAAQVRIEAAIVEIIAAAEIAAAAEQPEDRIVPVSKTTPAGQSLRSVPIRRLDEIDGALDADFIKMDVEGAEQMVWSGMGGLLARGRPLTIFMEFTISRFDRPHDFLDAIEQHGFSMSIVSYTDGVVPISREQLFAQSHFVDNMLVFVRSGDTAGEA